MTRTSPILSTLLILTLLVSGCLGTTAEVKDRSHDVDGAQTVTIDHALGTTTLTAPAGRVVVLEWSYTEALLALGVQPVGVADIEGYTSLVATDPGLGDDVTDVGTRHEPSLEVIASLAPDLIIGVEFRHSKIHDSLDAIAPTAIFDPWPENGTQLDRMRETVHAIGTGVGRTEAAEEALAELDASIEAGRDAIAAAGHAGAPFALAQVLAPEYGAFRLFQDHHAAVQIIEGLGLENAWDDEFKRNGFSSVGLEALEQVEEARFLYVPSSGASIERFEGNPSWDGLTFVEEGWLYDLSGAWLLPGPLSGQAFVDKVVAALTTDAPA